MDVLTFLNQAQFVLAIIGAIVSIIWYVTDKRRVRYAPFLWGIWCIILAVYRIYRWSDSNTAVLHASLASLLFTLGLVSVIFIGASNIWEAYKHGIINKVSK
jgi:hypothetical protein